MRTQERQKKPFYDLLHPITCPTTTTSTRPSLQTLQRARRTALQCLQTPPIAAACIPLGGARLVIHVASSPCPFCLRVCRPWSSDRPEAAKNGAVSHNPTTLEDSLAQRLWVTLASDRIAQHAPSLSPPQSLLVRVHCRRHGILRCPCRCHAPPRHLRSLGGGGPLEWRGMARA